MVHLLDDGTVEFCYFRPGARDVRLAGDFNNWLARADDGDATATHGSPMRRDEQGWWRTRLVLPAGEHRFKYIVDGNIWETDYAAYGVENDKLGGWNSIVWVAESVIDETRRIAA